MFLVVALQAEAQPLITHFGLRCEPPTGMFRIYRSDAMALVISGVGNHYQPRQPATFVGAAMGGGMHHGLMLVLPVTGMQMSVS